MILKSSQSFRLIYSVQTGRSFSDSFLFEMKGVPNPSLFMYIVLLKAALRAFEFPFCRINPMHQLVSFCCINTCIANNDTLILQCETKQERQRSGRFKSKFVMLF